jgi:hypothetical protein
MNKTSNKVSSAVSAGQHPSVRTGGISWVAYVILLLIAAFTVMLLVFLVQYLRVECPPSGRKGFWDYLSGMDATANPCNPPEPELEYEEREERHENEPWLIKDQIWTYPEAYQKCKAYGARLATKNEIVQAYNKGLQAPMYGWGQGEEAWQAIQPCSYVEMRRQGLSPAPPGVQGGRFDPNIRFGAFCYGVKPPGEVVVPKSDQCPYPEVCQRNPDACKPEKSDHIAAFYPGRKWSEFD